MASGVAHQRDSPARSSITLPPSGPVLVISPHLDDAALSCAALLDRREPLDVLTVFTESPEPPVQSSWATRAGFSDSLQSMIARREEDRQAFQDSGHRLHYLDLLELEYAPVTRPKSDSDAIGNVLRNWLSKTESATVVLPAGAGRQRRLWTRLKRRIRRARPSRQHPELLENLDHLFVRDAALDAMGSGSNCAILLYDELPYSLSVSADSAVAALASRLGARAVPLSAQIDRGQKARRIAAYRSQVPHLCPDGRRLDRPEALPAVERYWHLTAA